MVVGVCPDWQPISSASASSYFYSFSAVTSTNTRNWTTASSELLRQLLPCTYRSSVLDFLTISPLRHGKMILWRLASAWWKAAWILWYRIRWDTTWQDLPPDERALYGLHQPLWFHSDAMLHYEQTPRASTSTAHRRCIGMVVEPHRSFRLHVSRVFRVRSLADFIHHGGVWPSQQDFVRRHIDFTLGSVLPGRQAQWLRVLYTETTQIVERLGATRLVLPPNSGMSHLLPYLGCRSGDKVCLIPFIPRSALLCVVWTPTLPTKPHPLTLHSERVGVRRIQTYVKFSKHLQTILLPVMADLQFRLAFRLLPVRSRFWFLEATHPRIRICVRAGCDTIETEEHLFFDCTLAVQLWEHIHLLMSPFFSSRATWLSIVLASRPRVRDTWTYAEEVVCDVWHTLRAVTLHFLWTDRNRCLFDERHPTPALPALQVILATASAHFRHRLRHLYDPDQQARQHAVLARMSRYPLFQAYIQRNPSALHVRQRDI